MVAAAGLLAAACGGDGSGGGESSEYYVRATITLTDGQVIDFDQACNVTQADIMDESLWGIEAKDISVPIGLVFSWKESHVTGPGTHDASEGIGDFSVSVARQHPTDPSKVRISTAGDGRVTFSALDYAPGSAIDGTFDGIVMQRDEPDDQVHITADDGSFHCRVD